MQVRSCVSSHLPKLHLRPFLAFDTSAVQLWNSKRNFVIYILVKDAHEYNGKRSKSQIDQQNIGVIEYVSNIKAIEDLVPEKRKGPDNVLRF